MTEREVLKQMLEPTKEMIDAAERIDWSDSDVRGNIVNMWQAMCAAQPEQDSVAMADYMAIVEKYALLKASKPEQKPVAFPRQAGKSTWTVDTAFIWRVKHTIDPDTPNDFTPSEEQIETVLLALEKIPSKLYTTPPQPKQEPSFWMDSLDIEHRTPAIITNEDKREGHLNDWRCIHPVYTTPPQRTWQALTEDEINEVLGGDIRDEPSGLLEFVRAIEAAHGIKE